MRSHIGSVLSGGSALSMGISIQEVQDWFDLQESFSGVSYDVGLYNKVRIYSFERLQ